MTKKQRQVLEFIQDRQDAAGLVPTYREIAAHFGFNSPNAALAHIKALRGKGFLRNQPGRARTFQVLNPNAPKHRLRPRILSVPIYGSIPAGFPIDAAQEDEGCVLIDVETLGIKATARTFGLKVRGDSMIGKHIVGGDVVIIEHGLAPHPGDVVAALIDGQVTLKTFLMHRGKPCLRAENPRYPNLVPQEELQVQGVMVALVRKRK
ncbi:MAG: transcriptional repressor LexA [Verrucomicrobiota bacterium]